jgi:hypothetical protein
MNHIIGDAIHNRSVLQFSFRGHFREVEPHAYGLNMVLNEVMRCYQTSGTSDSGRVPDWKLMRVDQIKSLTVTAKHFVGVRFGYVKGDKSMSTIFCEL